MLNLVEVCAPKLGVDLAALGPKSNADPRFADVPVERLTSKEYAASLCGRIDMGRAAEPTVDVSSRGGTIYLTAGDRWGNMVSFIYSIYSGFGSGVSVPDYGFVLQNRGGLFSLDPDHPNIVAPRKRPFHTIIPAFITKDGAPVLSFGNMGGSVQPQAQATEVVNMVDLGMHVQAAGDAASTTTRRRTSSSSSRTSSRPWARSSPPGATRSSRATATRWAATRRCTSSPRPASAPRRVAA
jgi:gamma-glutamyltranspeptidase / glutathione hydrolase